MLNDFWNDSNREARTRRLKWGHIANYPAVLVEQLIRDETLTVEERNELVRWKMMTEVEKTGILREKKGEPHDE